MKESNQPVGLIIKLKLRLIKLPKLFSNSLFNLARKSDQQALTKIKKILLSNFFCLGFIPSIQQALRKL